MSLHDEGTSVPEKPTSLAKVLERQPSGEVPQSLIEKVRLLWPELKFYQAHNLAFELMTHREVSDGV